VCATNLPLGTNSLSAVVFYFLGSGDLPNMQCAGECDYKIIQERPAIVIFLLRACYLDDVHASVCVYVWVSL